MWITIGIITGSFKMFGNLDTTTLNIFSFFTVFMVKNIARILLFVWTFKNYRTPIRNEKFVWSFVNDIWYFEKVLHNPLKCLFFQRYDLYFYILSSVFCVMNCEGFIDYILQSISSNVFKWLLLICGSDNYMYDACI